MLEVLSKEGSVMKKILMAAVALTAVTATPAYSQTATFNVSGTVNAVCSFTGGTIAFGTINVNSDGTIATGQSASSAGQPGFYCNGAGTTLDLSHTAMTTSATPPGGFTSTINYTPAVVVGGSDQQVGDGTGVAFGAKAGSLVVDARNLTATGKLMAGAYSGTITLTLTPAS
jgi:spore coat protein U-like protein